MENVFVVEAPAWVVWLHLLCLSLTVPHALLFKSDHRAVLGWLGFMALLPVAGPALYWVLGINRVRRKAQGIETPRFTDQGSVPRLRTMDLRSLGTLEQVGLRVTGQRLLALPRIEPLENGERAYPAMLTAIAEARREVLLSSFIMEPDTTGHAFAAALADAQARGVRVYVLLDDLGRRFGFRSISAELRRRELPHRHFMPVRLLPPSVSLNLRNHRKLLIVDRRLAFTGGMNLSDRHLLARGAKDATADLHFELEGPVVTELADVFAEDWSNAEGSAPETLSPLEPEPEPEPEPEQAALTAEPEAQAPRCRLVVDGPGDQLDRLPLLLSAVVSAAKQSVRIMTPYFLPEDRLVGALQGAALRGVEVTVVIPEESNWRLVDWATNQRLWRLVNVGVKVFKQKPPFNHAKYLLIDDHYTLLGSTNLDPRSLRLNFELNLEVFDAGLSTQLALHFAAALSNAERVTEAKLRSRSMLTRLRDAGAAVCSPYL